MQESPLPPSSHPGNSHELNGDRRNANELQQLLLLIAELRKNCAAEASAAFGD
jgi:hypothetical protein